VQNYNILSKQQQKCSFFKEIAHFFDVSLFNCRQNLGYPGMSFGVGTIFRKKTYKKTASAARRNACRGKGEFSPRWESGTTVVVSGNDRGENWERPW